MGTFGAEVVVRVKQMGTGHGTTVSIDVAGDVLKTDGRALVGENELKTNATAPAVERVCLCIVNATNSAAYNPLRKLLLAGT
jgi:hypothetical protein